MAFSFYDNLPYLWGGRDPKVGLDCLSAASWVREQMGQRAIDLDLPDLKAVYADYPEESMMPDDYPLRLCRELCGEARGGQAFDWVVLRVRSVSCMGLLLPGGRIGFMGRSGGVTHDLSRCGGMIQGFFDPAAVLRSSVRGGLLEAPPKTPHE